MKLLTVGVLVAALAWPIGLAAQSPARGAHATACSPWRVRPLLSGQGWLESLAFDGRGAMTVSALAQGKMLRLLPDGRLSTLLAPVSFPGAQLLRGRFLYFTTGDILPAARTGTIDRLDLRTGRRATWARGLTMPNGLAFLPNGDAVISGAVGPDIGLTRVPAKHPEHPQTAWARLGYTNGLAVDPSGRWLYVTRDPPFSSDGEVDRVRISDPTHVQVVGRLGSGVFPDDMTIDRRGVLYIAGFAAGKIYRLDPRTHSACAIASGLNNPTAVVPGGRGWHSADLYVTDAAGHVSELTPQPR